MLAWFLFAKSKKADPMLTNIITGSVSLISVQLNQTRVPSSVIKLLGKPGHPGLQQHPQPMPTGALPGESHRKELVQLSQFYVHRSICLRLDFHNL